MAAATRAFICSIRDIVLDVVDGEAEAVGVAGVLLPLPLPPFVACNLALTAAAFARASANIFSTSVLGATVDEPLVTGKGDPLFDLDFFCA